MVRICCVAIPESLRRFDAKPKTREGVVSRASVQWNPSSKRTERKALSRVTRRDLGLLGAFQALQWLLHSVGRARGQPATPWHRPSVTDLLTVSECFW